MQAVSAARIDLRHSLPPVSGTVTPPTTFALHRGRQARPLCMGVDTHDTTHTRHHDGRIRSALTLGTAVYRIEDPVGLVLEEVTLLRREVQGLRQDLRRQPQTQASASARPPVAQAFPSEQVAQAAQTSPCEPTNRDEQADQTSHVDQVDRVAGVEPTRWTRWAELSEAVDTVDPSVRPGRVGLGGLYRPVRPPEFHDQCADAEQYGPVQPPTGQADGSTSPEPVEGASRLIFVPAAKRQVARQFRVSAERVLAIGGSLVTLVGAGLLLSMAVRAGWFGALPRVLALGVLSLVLAWSARRAHEERPDAAVGLAATATAGGFLVVVACTSFYGWLPGLLGVLAALGLAMVGAYVANVWRRELLADVVLVEVLLVLPLLMLWSPGREPLSQSLVLWVFFSCAAFLAMWPLVMIHGWNRLLALGVGAVSAVVMVAAITWTSAQVGDSWILVVTAVPISALLWAGCLVRHQPRLAVAPLATAFFVLVLVPHPLGGYGAIIMAAACAVAAARFGAAWLHVPAGVILLGTGTLKLVDPTYWVAATAAEALVLLFLPRAREVWWGSVGLAAFGTIALLVALPPSRLVIAGGIDNPLAAFMGAATLAGVGAAHVGTVDAGPTWPSARIRARAGFAVGIYAASAAVVAAGAVLSPGLFGFRMAHVALTALAVAASVFLLVRSLRHRKVAALLLGCAVAKLLLFDLVAVDGILRAGLFLTSGLLILVAATRMRHTAAR